MFAKLLHAHADPAVLFFLCSILPLQAAEIHVPEDYSTIQQGLLAAQSGDSVIAASGSYYENIVWPEVDNIILAAEDYESTIIDAEGNGRCLEYTGATHIRLTFIGIVFQNGDSFMWSRPGGDVFIQNADVTVEDCFVRDANSSLGAMALTEGRHSIRRSIFTGNFASPGSTGTGGAGLYCSGSGEIIECNFNGNLIWYGDGSATFVQGDYLFEDCVFETNALEMSDNMGGALGVGHNSGNVIIQGCRFISNYGYASAIIVFGHCLILNNLFLNNDTSGVDFGGTIMVTSGGADIQFNTFSNNSQNSIYFFPPESVCSVHHNILDHSIGYWDEGKPRTIVFHHNDYWPADLPAEPGEGEISADPVFVAIADGDYYLSQIAAGQTVTSPCVDAGYSGMTPPDGTTATNSLPDEGAPDIGYHYPRSLVPTPTVTPTVPEPTPSSTPAVQPTATPSQSTEVEITTNQEMYRSGDHFITEVRISNSGLPREIALFVALDIGNGIDYWFWPDWTHFPVDMDYDVMMLTEPLAVISVLDFIWPPAVGAGSGLSFWAVITEPDDFSAIDIARAEFSYR